MTARDATVENHGFSRVSATHGRGICLVLTAVYLWLCFIKLPLTLRRDAPEQSWEAVLSYATAHHLQWGRDIVFTFGPLGFLTSDHYWGNFFWPILLWALAFGLALALVFLRFSRRIAPSIRLVLYVALPLLTTPPCQDLGFDPIYFMAITLLGIACLPDERPSAAPLFVTGVFFGLFSLIKFTFAVYGSYAMMVILLSNAFAGRCLRTWPLIAGWLSALIAAACWTGQSPSDLALFFSRAAIMSGGYSSAMALAPRNQELPLAVVLLLGLAVLMVLVWRSHKDRLRGGGSVAIVAAGFALAWKEGFVRPDVHVVVFFLYSFFVAALLPALLAPQNGTPEQGSLPRSGFVEPVRNPRLQSVILVLTAILLVASLMPFIRSRKDFSATVQKSLLPRFFDTFEALLAPMNFKTGLDNQLKAMCAQAALPQIQAATGDSRIAVLGFDQEVAILNGLNYAPHPVFQNYSAYTPELQRLNTTFFNSDLAPDFVLCRLNTTLDGRFPTLDDGEVLLKVLTAYSPILQQKGFTLWRRSGSSGQRYTIDKGIELRAPLGNWVHITAEPAWLCAQFKRTWFGIVQSLLRAGPEIRIEVQLEDGRKANYRLIPGSAQHGFMLSPLFQLASDGTIELNRLKLSRVVAARISTSSPRSFESSVSLFVKPIYGLPRLGLDPSEVELTKVHEN